MPAIFDILLSPAAIKFYIGHTTEPVRERLRKHLANHNGFTAKIKDWKVVYTEEYSAKQFAYQRDCEKKIESRSRIQLLIKKLSRFSASEGSNPSGLSLQIDPRIL